MQQQRVLLGAGRREVPVAIAREAFRLRRHAELVVEGHDDGVGGVAPRGDLALVDAELGRSLRDSGPPRRRRLARLRAAMRLVKTLLSTSAVYSSGPVTPSMRKQPSASWCPSERQRRAVSTSSSSPGPRSNSVSPVAAT